MRSSGLAHPDPHPHVPNRTHVGRIHRWFSHVVLTGGSHPGSPTSVVDPPNSLKLRSPRIGSPITMIDACPRDKCRPINPILGSKGVQVSLSFGWSNGGEYVLPENDRTGALTFDSIRMVLDFRDIHINLSVASAFKHERYHGHPIHIYPQLDMCIHNGPGFWWDAN